jgi:serine protease Do
MSEQKPTTDLKSIITITVVVSFVVSVLTGFIAAGIGYNLISSDQEKSQRQKQKQTDENSKPSVDSASSSVVGAVEKVSPAVVSVIVTKDLPVMERYYEEFGPFGFRIPRYRQEGTEERQIGGGTGFIVSSDGLILTNKHVVSDKEADYTVLTNDEERISAKVLARDPVHDIAVLKIDKTGLPVVKLGDSDNLKIGQKVIAIGNALGEFRNTVSTGVVSGLRRSITAQGGGGQPEQLSGLIQTDAAVNQGNSGGPLLNIKGEAVGINVAMAQSAENIGFALPINRAKRDLEQVRRKGEISYPFLGVRYVTITSEIQEKNNLEVDYGALIVRGDSRSELAVVPGSPADKADLRENDIILEVNGEKVTQDNPLSELIQKQNIGEEITLKVWSKGKTENIKVTLGER